MDPIIIFIEVALLIGGGFFWTHFNKRIGSFSGEIAKIEAVSNKINEIIDQQKKITKATEETKADIAHLAWNKKEHQTIKRNKLEKYLEDVFEILETMRVNAAKINGTEKVEIEPLPIALIPKFTTIQMLYLPELKEENKIFTDLISNYESIVDDVTSEKIDFENFSKKMITNFTSLGVATKNISIKSQEVIEVMFEP